MAELLVIFLMGCGTVTETHVYQPLNKTIYQVTYEEEILKIRSSDKQPVVVVKLDLPTVCL